MILGDVRDKLYHTRERSRQLLSNGISDIPEEATFTNVEQVSNLYTLDIVSLLNCCLILTTCYFLPLDFFIVPLP